MLHHYIDHYIDAFRAGLGPAKNVVLSFKHDANKTFNQWSEIFKGYFIYVV